VHDVKQYVSAMIQFMSTARRRKLMYEVQEKRKTDPQWLSEINFQKDLKPSIILLMGK